MDKARKKIIRSWMMYDWANSAFATTIMAAVLPEFYSSVAGSTLDSTIATSYWGYSNTIAMLTIAITAPFLGAIGEEISLWICLHRHFSNRAFNRYWKWYVALCFTFVYFRKNRFWGRQYFLR